MSLLEWITREDHEEVCILSCAGSWRSSYLARIDKALEALAPITQPMVEIHLEGLLHVDTAGAWRLLRFLRMLSEQGHKLHLKGARKDLLHLMDALRQHQVREEDQVRQVRSLPVRLLEQLGQKSVTFAQEAHLMVQFLGEVVITLGALLRRPGSFRGVSFLRQLQLVGVNALPIVGLISFLIGIVLVYQGADQLRRFGAEIFTIDLLAVSILREIGILLTAIVVAGRSGSAFTAQIGYMKLNQEVDAMMVMGFHPVVFLVIPRIFALVVALPLLAFYADMMGLLGGYVMAQASMGITFSDFFHHLNLSISPWTFWTGMLKAPLFAFVIAFVSCYEGLRVSGGAESVGLRTTRAVVESIFLVIVLDAAYSILFAMLGV